LTKETGFFAKQKKSLAHIFFCKKKKCKESFTKEIIYLIDNKK